MRIEGQAGETRTARGALAGERTGSVTQWLLAGLVLAVAVALAPMPSGRSQVPGQNVGTPGTGTMRPYVPRATEPFEPDTDFDAVTRERRLNALNIQRQRELVSDTNKLLRLARELNAEIAANNTGSLTDVQVHKVAEIEKLAKNVKERMAEGVPQPMPTSPAPIVLPVQ